MLEQALAKLAGENWQVCLLLNVMNPYISDIPQEFTRHSTFFVNIRDPCCHRIDHTLSRDADTAARHF